MLLFKEAKVYEQINYKKKTIKEKTPKKRVVNQ